MEQENENKVRVYDPWAYHDPSKHLSHQEWPRKEYPSNEEWEIDRKAAIKHFELKGKMSLSTWRDISAKEFPPERWLIKDLIPCEGVVVLASISGEKKTWIALAMAKSIASGSDFLGSTEFKTQKAKVLYIDQEMAQKELQRRCKKLGFDNITEDILFMSGGDLNLNKKEDKKDITERTEQAEKLLEIIRDNKINIVFIDTFRAVAGGLKEEKAEEVRAFFNQFKTLKDEGVVLVFLDHCRKPQRFEGKDPKKEQLFASQDKVASAEVLLMIKSESGSNEIFMYQRKNRLGKEIDPFQINIKEEMFDGGESAIELTYGGLFAEKDNKFEEAAKVIPGVLENGGMFIEEVVDYLFANFSIGERNTKDAVRKLSEDGGIKKIRKGRKNFYLSIDEIGAQEGDSVQESLEAG